MLSPFLFAAVFPYLTIYRKLKKFMTYYIQTITMNKKKGHTSEMLVNWPNWHGEGSYFFKLRGPTIGTKLLLKRMCPILRVIILHFCLSNSVIHLSLALCIGADLKALWY